MNSIENFIFQKSIHALVIGVLIGGIVSFNLCLNFRLQNFLKTKHGAIPQVVQLICYLVSVAITSFSIVVLAGKLFDGKDISLAVPLLLALGVIGPVVLAFKTGFIPERK